MQNNSAKMTMREHVANLLIPSKSGNTIGRAFDKIIILFILVSVAAAVLSTESSIYWPYRNLFQMIEAVSIVFFIIEYFGRLWIAPEALGMTDKPVKARLKWMFSFDGIIDFLAISPVLISMFFPLDLRLLRLLRLLRIFKLARYSNSFGLLFDVFSSERRSIQAALSVLLMLIVCAATGAYFFERVHQPDSFGSIPKAMWWAVVTLTTVGYGDVYPVTAPGKAFGAMVTLLGIGMAALPAGIMASGFSDQMRIRRQHAENEYFNAILSGRIAPENVKALNRLRRSLGITALNAHEIEERAVAALSDKNEDVCAECGQTKGV